VVAIFVGPPITGYALVGGGWLRHT